MRAHTLFHSYFVTFAVSSFSVSVRSFGELIIHFSCAKIEMKEISIAPVEEFLFLIFSIANFSLQRLLIGQHFNVLIELA